MVSTLPKMLTPVDCDKIGVSNANIQSNTVDKSKVLNNIQVNHWKSENKKQGRNKTKRQINERPDLAIISLKVNGLKIKDGSAEWIKTKMIHLLSIRNLLQI